MGFSREIVQVNFKHICLESHHLRLREAFQKLFFDNMYSVGYDSVKIVHLS